MSEAESEAPVERKLFGAAKIAAERKAQGQGLESFLATLHTGLDERLSEAQEAVRVADEVASTARKNLRLIESLIAVRDGTFQLTAPPEPAQRAPRAAGVRAPRAEGLVLRGKIKETLAQHRPDGLPVSQILQTVDHGGNPQRVRNALAAMKSGDKPELGYKDGWYFVQE